MNDDRHFFLDTGIYHSLACSFGVIGKEGVVILTGHEDNATISGEVSRQHSDSSLAGTISMMLPLMQRLARDPCNLPTLNSEVETVRNELLADSRLRHPYAEVSRTAAEHAGEAELICLSAGHTPVSVIFCNDAGASAVAHSRGVPSAHFLHVVRALVKAGQVPANDAVGAGTVGLKESRLQNGERSRTLNFAWLAG